MINFHLFRIVDLLWRFALTAAYRLLLCYWFVFRPTTHGVYVAIWWRQRVLLITNSYKPGQSLPAGGVKRGEPPLDAALRELHEEVGLRLAASDLRYVGNSVGRDEYKVDKCEVYEAMLAEEPRIVIDRREVVRAEFVDVEEALRRPLVHATREYLSRLRVASH